MNTSDTNSFWHKHWGGGWNKRDESDLSVLSVAETAMLSCSVKPGISVQALRRALEGKKEADVWYKSATTTVLCLPSTSSYEQFFLECLVPNRPCLFERGIGESWLARQLWRNKSNDGLSSLPNFQYLVDKYGSEEVPVMKCSEGCTHKTVTFHSYINECFSSSKVAEKDLEYMKDWHFVKNHPSVQL